MVASEKEVKGLGKRKKENKLKTTQERGLRMITC